MTELSSALELQLSGLIPAIIYGSNINLWKITFMIAIILLQHLS